MFAFAPVLLLRTLVDSSYRDQGVDCTLELGRETNVHERIPEFVCNRCETDMFRCTKIEGWTKFSNKGFTDCLRIELAVELVVPGECFPQKIDHQEKTEGGEVAPFPECGSEDWE